MWNGRRPVGANIMGWERFWFFAITGKWELGGIMLIWDTRIFTWKEAMGDKRFIAVKGEWKGINGEVFWIEKITEEGARDLEKYFNENEVLEAIRGCGGDKASGTDGLNFKFIRKIWNVIKPDLLEVIRWFWDRMEISRGCNSSFVSIIQKVVDPIGLDGVLIANETMEFLKKKKEKCKWVDTCLRSTSMSILVNGSPTEEFRIERGVRQGDPLSPFLFILAAESLNAIVKEAVAKGIFRWVKVGSNRVGLSHLQYVDDTIFFGEWNKENSKCPMGILKCFEEVFGLRANYNKSKLYGIGVNESELGDMARWMC
ncbi:reverse transcriptase domain, reverse transcriptase zinc-binding domain protein [Tanacetum coccineum]